ncbi:hypothetical protein OUZ56_032502 [Daphnia magna]|uniref:Uncharacterized protein n=1 Tax=Daphnia magna TaxID=35525 RepID=A0ABR0B934_9CRUS|nr:hypothetical protein OUZ56_032502 [Daphnia magna]
MENAASGTTGAHRSSSGLVSARPPSATAATPRSAYFCACVRARRFLTAFGGSGRTSSCSAEETATPVAAKNSAARATTRHSAFIVAEYKTAPGSRPQAPPRSNHGARTRAPRGALPPALRRRRGTRWPDRINPCKKAGIAGHVVCDDVPIGDVAPFGEMGRELLVAVGV